MRSACRRRHPTSSAPAPPLDPPAEGSSIGDYLRLVGDPDLDIRIADAAAGKCDVVAVFRELLPNPLDQRLANGIPPVVCMLLRVVVVCHCRVDAVDPHVG